MRVPGYAVVAMAVLLLAGCGVERREAEWQDVTESPATVPAEPPGSPEPTIDTVFDTPTPALTPTPTPNDQPEPEPEPVPLDDVRLAWEPVAGDWDQPIYVTAPPEDGRLFVLERPGRVWVLDGDERRLFLDLSDRTAARREQGLLGLAFHPDYGDNGRLFVHYTDLDGHTRLAEYRAGADPHAADPQSRRDLLEVEQPAGNHNGGMVAFGPDGMLYLALGDGGGSGDAYGHGQRADTPLGTILRLDVDVDDPPASPPDNPFVDGGGAPEVWHYGLRNPWRFAFDDALLYIADVGQDRWEEINVVPADEGGLNFGWPIMEAGHCFDPPEGCPTEGLVVPALEYRIREGPCAVIGGFVYRGQAIAGLDGHYLYSDYCAGFLRSFRYDDGAVVDERDWTEQTGTVGAPYSFGQDAAGELYLTDADAGQVLKLVPGG